MAFDAAGKLIVADPYYGLLSLDVEKKKVLSAYSLTPTYLPRAVP